MSQQEPPPKITDKRKQRAAEAQAKAAAAEHPVASEETVLTVNRLERIHELKQKAIDGGANALTEEDNAELLRLQAEEEAAEQEARAQDENAVEARTAFYVLVMHDGSVKVEPDCNTMLSLDHMPTVDEMYTGLALAKRDIEAALAAKHTVFQLQQQAAAGMSRRLQQPPSGIVPPGRR